ncbi:hypothetical protein Fot_41806 [Forsythia ovata]|uniref:Uncharacterized protein n=1 Tax=Forsythia ovata TaxID=205694 RepID=A0ABD1RN54_9LAMI
MFKIRSEGVVGEKEDISPQSPVLRTMSVLQVSVPQASEAIVATSTAVPLALEIAVGIPSVLTLKETLLSLEDIRRSGKKKMVADDEEETAMPRRNTDGDGSLRDSRKMKRDREAHSWRADEHASHRYRDTTRPSIPPPGWSEYINIRS